MLKYIQVKIYILYDILFAFFPASNVGLVFPGLCLLFSTNDIFSLNRIWVKGFNEFFTLLQQHLKSFLSSLDLYHLRIAIHVYTVYNRFS